MVAPRVTAKAITMSKWPDFWKFRASSPLAAQHLWKIRPFFAFPSPSSSVLPFWNQAVWSSRGQAHSAAESKPWAHAVLPNGISSGASHGEKATGQWGERGKTGRTQPPARVLLSGWLLTPSLSKEMGGLHAQERKAGREPFQAGELCAVPPFWSSMWQCSDVGGLCQKATPLASESIGWRGRRRDPAPSSGDGGQGTGPRHLMPARGSGWAGSRLPRQARRHDGHGARGKPGARTAPMKSPRERDGPV